MSAPSPQLVPLFRSDTQLQILIELFSKRPATGSDLARRLDVPQQTVAQELARLEDADLIVAERVGAAKLYEPNPALPYRTALGQLLAYAGGVIPILQRELGPITDISEVFIFGSWAERFHGNGGPPPNDIDVMVVSDTLTRFDLAEHRMQLTSAVGTPVDLFVLPNAHPQLDEHRARSVPVLASVGAS